MFQKVKRNNLSAEEIYVQTNVRNVFEVSPPEIARIVPVDEWINRLICDDDQGFGKETTFFRAKRMLLNTAARFLEELLGENLFIKVKDDEWDFLGIELRFLKIAKELKERGVIASVVRSPSRPDWPNIPTYHFFLEPIEKPNGKKIRLLGSTSGGGLTSNEAFAAAAAETIERHELCVWNPSKIIRSSYAALSRRGVKAVDPLRFRIFSDKQLSDEKMRQKHYFDHDTQFDWTETESLLGRQRYLVPAQLIYIGYDGSAPEPSIRQASTSGSAAGETRERAVYSGICENIERDAFMMFWMNMIPPIRIDPNTIEDDDVQKLIQLYKDYRLETTIFDIGTDTGVPVFSILCIDRSGRGPALHISNAAHLDARTAVRKALIENIKFSSFGARILTGTKMKAVDKMYPNFDITTRSIWWSQLKTLREIGWLFRGPVKPFRYERVQAGYPEQLATLKKFLNDLHQEAYIADISSSLAKQHNLYVIASLMPGFIPLHLTETYKGLGIERLHQLPVKLGFLKEPRREDQMNSIPHPMA